MFDERVKITLALIEILSPFFSYRKKNVKLFALNRNINEKDSSIETSLDKTQLEDNEDSIKKVKNSSSNTIPKKLEKKNSFQILNKADLKPFKSITNKNEQQFKFTNYIPIPNYKPSNPPKFPHIIKKRPTTVSSTCKLC